MIQNIVRKTSRNHVTEGNWNVRVKTEPRQILGNRSHFLKYGLDYIVAERAKKT